MAGKTKSITPAQTVAPETHTALDTPVATANTDDRKNMKQYILLAALLFAPAFASQKSGWNWGALRDWVVKDAHIQRKANCDVFDHWFGTDTAKHCGNPEKSNSTSNGNNSQGSNNTTTTSQGTDTKK